MRVDFCGVRGSTPAPGEAFLDVGGNTSCVAVTHQGAGLPTLILDAGTGIRAVTALTGGRAFRGTILLSHLHWDHTQGLPFFEAADRVGASTTVLAPEQGAAVDRLIDRFMSPPSFPVRLGELRGDWQVGSICEGQQHIERFEVLAREIPHKGGRTFGYRIEELASGASIAYLPDHGPRDALGAGPHGWGPYHPAAMELADNVDVLIHDAQHTADELLTAFPFGHSAADYAVELGRRSGAGEVVLFHHHPSRTDPEVAAMTSSLQTLGQTRVSAAVEGRRIELAGGRCSQEATA